MGHLIYTKHSIYCPECNQKRKLTTSEFESRIKNKFEHITLLSEYTNAFGTIKYKCDRCGYEHEAEAHSLLKRQDPCLNCTNRLPTDPVQLKDELESYANIEILSDFIRLSDTVDCQCKICNKKWKTKVAYIKSGYGVCPFCNTNSKGERAITKYLLERCIDFEPQKTFKQLISEKGRNLSYDFYLPNYNLLIEYQGEQHYEPVELFGGEDMLVKQQERDKIKRQYAKNNKYYLLEIPYWSFQDVDTILDDTLNNIKNCMQKEAI